MVNPIHLRSPKMFHFAHSLRALFVMAYILVMSQFVFSTLITVKKAYLFEETNSPLRDVYNSGGLYVSVVRVNLTKSIFSSRIWLSVVSTGLWSKNDHDFPICQKAIGKMFTREMLMDHHLRMTNMV